MMKCVICKKEIEKSSFSNDILCSTECFHTHLWDERVAAGYNPNIVRIDGVQYYIGKENIKSSSRGFGGTKFIIKFNDGREVTTTNLWHNGKIPESHKRLLPDNAKFIKEILK